jgi:hypothetical protein
VPSAKDAGKTDARMTKYVGEHVEKTGPSAAPTKASPQKLCCLMPFPRSLLESVDSLESPGTFSQSDGKRSVSPKIIRMPPERYVQNSGGIIMKAVDAFSRYVKRIMETANEPTTIYGVHELLPVALEPMTTGKSGKTHGARTVSTPAINETIKNVMQFQKPPLPSF